MRIGKFHIETYKWEPRDEKDKKFIDFDYEHKYWYLRTFYFGFGKHRRALEVCRTDWNKSYKQRCKNYTKKCKHCMDCNECKSCFEEK